MKALRAATGAAAARRTPRDDAHPADAAARWRPTRRRRRSSATCAPSPASRSSHHAAPEKKYIVESMSGGVALFDFDHDGRVDIYFVDSLTVETASDPKAARSALYRNLGGMKFEDVTDKRGRRPSGLGHGRRASPTSTRDGWDDLYVTALGGNKLYRNNHDGTFTDRTDAARLAGGGWSAGCGFADYDRDGDLDLFVSRYVKIDLANLPEFGKGKTCEYRGVAVQCGPRGLPGETRPALPQRRRRRFTEVRREGGRPRPARVLRPGRRLVRRRRGRLARPLRRQRLDRELPLPQPARRHVQGDRLPHGRRGQRGRRRAGRHGRGGRRLRPQRPLQPVQDQLRRGVQQPLPQRRHPLHRRVVPLEDRGQLSLPYVGWGTAFLDYDNDGWLDLIAVNGHVYPQLDQARLGASAGYRQRKLLYRNRGDGTFDEVAARTAPCSPTSASAAGSRWATSTTTGGSTS